MSPKYLGQLLLDTVEIYLPTLSFIVMFLVFVLQVIYRYALNNPLTWPPEIISMTFIWTTVLGACYAQRKAEHVSFTVVYDRLSAMGQLVFRMLGNGFIALAFMIALPAVYEYVTFMDFQKTTVLRIPLSVVFAPFLIFQVLIIGRMLYALALDVGVLLGRRPLEREESMTPSEVVDSDFQDLLPEAGRDR